MGEIPYGHCHCGCGLKTRVSEESNRHFGYIKGEPLKYIHGHRNKMPNSRWTGETQSGGYKLIRCPDHPRADERGYVREALGKLLPEKAIVHHGNGTKISGPLVICQDEQYHRLLHQRMRAHEACGHAGWRKCQFCQRYDDPEKLRFGKRTIWHHECRKQLRREKMAKTPKFAILALILIMLAGCAAMVGLEQTGTMGGLDGSFRIFTDRTADKMGINTVSTFVVKDEDRSQKSTLVYGNTAGQPGIGKAIVEQILPAISNAAIGTFTGAFFPKPGSTNVTTGNVTQGQGQGQTTTQLQGQGQVQ
jgi:hypothetical protein